MQVNKQFPDTGIKKGMSEMEQSLREPDSGNGLRSGDLTKSPRRSEHPLSTEGQQEVAQKVTSVMQEGDKNPLSQSSLLKTESDRPQQTICQICQQAVHDEHLVGMGTCTHQYCYLCMKQYLIYKISMMERPDCPNEDCAQILHENSPIFTALPPSLQQQYRKIQEVGMRKPGEKLCGQPYCKGTYFITDPTPQCNLCGQGYCGKCLNVAHEGACVGLMCGKLGLRQCKQCGNIIDKWMGCNHIKCPCGQQFCYVCGETWTNHHYACGKNSFIVFNRSEYGWGEGANCCPCWNSSIRMLKLIFICLFWLIFAVPFYGCCVGLLVLVLLLYIGYGLLGIGLFIYCFEERLQWWVQILMVIGLPISILYTTGLVVWRGLADLAPSMGKIVMIPCHSVQAFLP